jgi:AcrR family transcriptional regulator
MEAEVAVRKRATTKGDATREAVKQAAKRAIASDGFSGVKIADIMAKAGKSPGAFYLYFKTKEQLLLELVEDFRRRLKDEVNKPLEERETAFDTLSARLGAFWKIYRDDWPTATAAFQMAMVDSQFERAWRNVRQQGIRGVSMLIELSKKQGYSRDLDTELAASALCSMLEYTCYNWTAKGGDFPDRFIDDATAVKVLSYLFVNAVSGGHGLPGAQPGAAA